MATLNVKELSSYGIGDAGQALLGTMISFYQLYYLTDVVKLPIGSIAGLFVLTKIIDCLSFPAL